MSLLAPGTPTQRRPAVVATNSLVLLLPPNLFAPTLLPLFKAHFASYGPVAAWTPLEKLGRVLVVYEDVDSATAARREMDGFVWDDEDEDEAEAEGGNTMSYTETQSPSDPSAASHPVDSNSGRSTPPFRAPLRAFFGPSLALPLSSIHNTLLAVPALSRNFLISPPGSPPVGWEQTLEEAPNAKALPHHPEDDELGMGWSDELSRALRFLSVSSSGDDDGDAIAKDDKDLVEDPDTASKTHTIVSSSGAAQTGPSITLSTPPTPAVPVVGSDTPPPGAAKITAVKATIESMLGRRRSFGALDPQPLGRVITPTARPPTDDEPEYHP